MLNSYTKQSKFAEYIENQLRLSGYQEKITVKAHSLGLSPVWVKDSLNLSGPEDQVNELINYSEKLRKEAYNARNR